MSTAHLAGHNVPINSQNNPQKKMGVIFISTDGETEAQVGLAPSHTVVNSRCCGTIQVCMAPKTSCPRTPS